MLVDCALYRDGVRQDGPRDLTGVAAAARAGDGMAWIGLDRPDDAEFAEVAREFGLHPLAVEDAVHAHQRPKLERYGDTLYCVLRPARYIDESETVEFGELHVFAGPNFVVSSRQDDARDLAGARAGLESRPELLRRGPVVILHAIMDRVVYDYAPVVAGLENDIDEIEDEVFGGSPSVSRRIYEFLSREVIAFGRASTPLAGMLDPLLRDPGVGDEERRYLRDVQDHALRVQEQVDGSASCSRAVPERQPHARDEGAQRGVDRPERRGEAHLGLGRHPLRADADRDDLRHELPPHADPLARGLPAGARPDGRHVGHALPALPAARLDLSDPAGARGRPCVMLAPDASTAAREPRRHRRGAAAARDAPGALGGLRHGAQLAMVGVDATAVNVATPAIGDDFDAALSSLQWVINAYTLALAGLVAAGRVAGRPLRTAAHLRDRGRLVRGRFAAVRRRAQRRRC